MASFPVQVATGILCASYWRGSWYVLDHTLYPDDRFASGAVSLAAGSALLGMKQYILSPSYNGTKRLVRMLPPPQTVSLRTRFIQTNRFIVLYGIASACVLIWRGTWLLWDEGAHVLAEKLSSATPLWGTTPCSHQLESSIEEIKPPGRTLVRQISENTSFHPDLHLDRKNVSLTKHHLDLHDRREDHHLESTVTDHGEEDERVLFYSGIASHVLATAGLLIMGRFASVMAPPANVSMLRDVFIHGKGKEFARATRVFARSS